jgi:hypothetical protein
MVKPDTRPMRRMIGRGKAPQLAGMPRQDRPRHRRISRPALSVLMNASAPRADKPF